MITLKDHINKLVAQHGSLRAVSRVTGVNLAYLSRLRSGRQNNPGKDQLRRLKLRRVIVELPDENELEAWRKTADELRDMRRFHGPTIQKAAFLLQNAYMFGRKTQTNFEQSV